MKLVAVLIPTVAMVVAITTCSTVPKVPDVDGAVMELGRLTDALFPGESGYDSTLQLSWLGTACHYIQLGDLGILTDLFVTNGVSLGSLMNLRSDPKRVSETLKRVQSPPDAVFVNHAHSDHILDAHAAMELQSWKQHRVLLYGGRSVRNILAGWGDDDVLRRTHEITASQRDVW